MGQVQGIQHRHGTYFARLVIPIELRPALDGKTELRERLGTDRRLAERDVHAALARFHERLAQARLEIRPVTPTPSRPMSTQALARAFYAQELEFDDCERIATSKLGLELERTFKDGHVAVLAKVASRRASDEETNGVIGWAIEAMQARGSTTVKFASPQWRELAYTLAAVQLEAIKRQAERDHGDFSGSPALPVLTEENVVQFPSRPDQNRVLGPESLMPLSDIVALMHREKRNIRPSTQAEQVVAARMFEEFAGEALPVHRITRRMVLGYKDALASVPVLYTQRFRGKTLPEAIESNKLRVTPFPTLAPKTINSKWLVHLASTLNWAVTNDVIPDNPARGVRLDVGGGDAEPSRVPFTGEDMKNILGSPTFQGELGERQWSVLVAIYSGMRASEIAQLRLDGIRRERGILVFEVDGELKTAGSRRLVPVHSALVARGLDTWIANRRAQGETHLLPVWFERGSKMKASAALRGKAIQQPFATIHPKWFTRFLLPKLGLADSRKTFHSLRHTFKTALAVAGVSRELSDALTGHRDHSVGARYVHGVSIEALRDAVEKMISLEE